jgi:hypothetical protein
VASTAAVVGCAAVAIAAGAFALVSTLRPPTPGDRVAVRLFARLVSERGTGGVMHLDGRTIRVHCRPLRSSRSLITVGDVRLVLHGLHVHPAATRGERAELDDIPADGALLAAEADLSGSFTLYERELLGRIDSGRRLLAGETHVGAQPAYRILLNASHPLIELIVSRHGLRPLVAVFRSRSLSGRTVIGTPIANEHRGC